MPDYRKIPDWVAVKILNLLRAGFYGNLTLHFKGGHIHRMTKEESIKPDN